MKFYKNLIFIIFISIFASNIIAAESDNVKTDSTDFNTGNYEDEITFTKTSLEQIFDL